MERYEHTPELTPHDAESIRAYARATARLPLGACSRCGAAVRLFTLEELTRGRLCRLCV
jgi:hypothetical protein